MGCALSNSIRSDPDALADALFDAMAAARVPKGTLDVPVRPHARRLSSGRRGISRKMLRAIRRIYRVHGALGMLMSDVCKEEGFEWSVCALTRSTGLSLTESLVLTAEARGEVVDALIGLATTFFSYSWDGTKLGDMLDAIERRLAELEAADGVTRYVWIDMFAASQTLLAGEFDAGRYPRGSEEHKARKEDTDHVFADAMAVIREILLYCSPLTAEWPAPNQPFLLPERGAPPARWLRRGPGAMTRAWCLFELVKALAKGATLHVVLAPADVDGFEALLLRRFGEIAGIVAGIDAADAQITKIEDRNYILAEVAQLEGGIGAVTATVCASLREWLAAEGRAALARMPREERAMSVLQNQLGRLLHYQGKLDEAGVLLRDALEASRATLGDRHPKTLTSINHLGLLLQYQGKLDEAGVLLREALEARRATLGDRHPDTLESMNNLGGLLQDQGELEEAGVLLREALEARRATLGDRHPGTLTSIGSLGRLLKAQGKLDEAGVLIREALEARRATLGDRHPKTLVSIGYLGRLLQDQGKLDEAGVLYREALEASRATLGDRHPSTLISIAFLGRLLHDQGRLGEAETLLLEAHDGCAATLAEGHHTRLRSQAWLADVRRAQGRIESARALVDARVLSTARAALGPTVDTTLMLEAVHARLECAAGGGLSPLQAALERMRTVLGPEHAETHRCAVALSQEEEAASRAGSLRVHFLTRWTE
jgi:tetratricopeptide (TPR) repeat protein